MTYPSLTYVIIYSIDGKQWHLQGTASENHHDVCVELARLQRDVPLVKYGMKCVDSYLWQAIREAAHLP